MQQTTTLYPMMVFILHPWTRWQTSVPFRGYFCAFSVRAKHGTTSYYGWYGLGCNTCI